MNWAKARCRISVITLVLLGWSGAAWAQADHGLGFSRSNTTPLHVQDYYAIRFVITANQDTCGDRLQARDMAVEIRRDDGSVAYPTTWGFIELIRNTGYWTLENGAYWGDGAGTPNPAGPYIIFPPLTDPANPPRATGTADVAGTVRFPIYQVTQDDYAVGPTMNDTVTLRWYDECGGQCNDCVSGPYENSLDGTAVLASPSTNVDIIAYIDANGNGTFDEGEGVDSVCANQSVDLYITETNDGAYDLINVNVAIRQGDDATNTWSVLQNWVIGNLVQGATAELNILDVVITEETDFEAIGSGADPEGFLVTWCDGPSQDPTVVCDADEREVITVLVVETPPCEILVPEDVCAGSGTFQACFDGPPAVDYFKWELSGCGEDAPIVLAEGADVDCATVPVPAVGDCTLTVTLTTTLAGCVSQCQAQVTVNASPACSIDGPTAVCEETQNTAHCGPAGMAAYSWSIAGNGTIDGAANAQCVTVDAGAPGSYTLTLTIVDQNGCTSTCGLPVTVRTDPACSITGPTQVYENTTTAPDAYCEIGGDGDTWAWSVVSGNATIVGSGSCVGLSVGAAGWVDIQVVVTDAAGCQVTCMYRVQATHPAVDLEKLVNGNDADTPTGPVVEAGSTVTFEFVVTNTGNIALTNVVVTDDVLGVIGTIATLAVGAQQTLIVTTPALIGQHTNMGSVTTDEGVSDEDAGNYFGQVTPCIAIEKYVNGEEADVEPVVVTPGDPITWTYVVTNCGTISLTDIVVIDDNGTPGDDNDDFFPTPVDVSPADGFNDGDVDLDGELDVDEIWLYEAFGTAVVGWYENVGCVVGAYLDTEVDDCDSSNYFGCVEGRMTGGGTIGHSDVSHGFELHCDPTWLPNRLQINWGKGKSRREGPSEHFHLEELTNAICSDDAGIDPRPPRAGIDTYEGWGTGRYMGVPGATAHWIFTDAGEPGRKDWSFIEIRDASGALVLRVSGYLTVGNHQAHKTQSCLRNSEVPRVDQ